MFTVEQSQSRGLCMWLVYFCVCGPSFVVASRGDFGLQHNVQELRVHRQEKILAVFDGLLPCPAFFGLGLEDGPQASVH